MQKERSIINTRGFSVVEALLASAIFALLVVGTVGAFLYGQESTALSGNRDRATLYAEEGLEAARNIRDAGFSNLIDGTYGIATTGNQWSFSGSSDVKDIFTRAVSVASVDTKRKLITSTVSWQQNGQRTGQVSLSSRLTYWMAVAAGNWSIPLLDSSFNLTGNDNGTRLQVSGDYVYLLRPTALNNFVIMNVSNTAVPTVAGTLSLSNSPNNIFVLGNYAYVTGSANTAELVIIDISAPALPFVAATFDITGTSDAYGVYVEGVKAYVSRYVGGGDEFVIVNVTTPSSPTLFGSVSLAANGAELVVSGNYAYVASNRNNQEIQVVNISNPLTPVLTGGLDLVSNNDAITIAIAGNTLVVGQGTSVVTVGITTPGTPVYLGSVATPALIFDIALEFGNGITYAYLGTDEKPFEFKVADISVLTAPVILGKLNITGNYYISGIAYDSLKDRAFGIGNSDTQELVIFKPQ